MSIPKCRLVDILFIVTNRPLFRRSRGLDDARINNYTHIVLYYIFHVEYKESELLI